MAQIANPSVPALYEDALVYETGSAITSSGALSAHSGAKTGRSPSDKRIVKEESSEKDVWWGPVNKPMTTDVSFVTFPCPCTLPCVAAVKLSGSGIFPTCVKVPLLWMLCDMSSCDVEAFMYPLSCTTRR